MNNDRASGIFPFLYGAAYIPYAFRMKNVFCQCVHCCCFHSPIYPLNEKKKLINHFKFELILISFYRFLLWREGDKETDRE